MKHTKTEIPIIKLVVNSGQIPGVPKNPRKWSQGDVMRLAKSIQETPELLELRGLIAVEHEGKYVVLGGNLRLAAGKFLNLKTMPVEVVEDCTTAKMKEIAIKDNGAFGQWDASALLEEWGNLPLDDWGVDGWQIPETESSGGKKQQGASLNDRFVVPPLSILDTRKGYWQVRKKMWREQIGDMGESRKDKLTAHPEMKYATLYHRTRKHREELGVSFREYLEKYVSVEVLEHEASKVLSQGVSLFDPVLSETMCKWFTPYAGAKIFDCFAGDTQKGLVFAMCGFSFRGVELRQEQVDINNRVLEGRGLDIEYICDDGQNVEHYFEPESQDMLFSCPPYYDLEVYSKDERDASNQGAYEDFIAILDKAFKAALTCLKPNRFAVIVVGDVRDKKTGFYRGFPDDVKRIFKEGGAFLYNEIILVESVGSAALRAAPNMETRKVSKTHQNVLVFYKGDPKSIRANFPKIAYNAADEQAFAAEIAAEQAIGTDAGNASGAPKSI